jgi:hypothetical protein
MSGYRRLAVALLIGVACVPFSVQAQEQTAPAPVEAPILQGPAPVLPVEQLMLHPEVEKAVIAARGAETRARAKAAEAREAKTRADAAAALAEAAATKARGGQDGHAVQNFAGNGRYEGQYENGVRKGAGIFVSTDGERFAGEWAANIRGGFGVSKARTGVSFSGTWRNGGPCGVGVVSWPNGDRYEGEYCLSRITGYGVLISGERENHISENAGQWVDDSRRGPAYATGNMAAGAKACGATASSRATPPNMRSRATWQRSSACRSRACMRRTG